MGKVEAIAAIAFSGKEIIEGIFDFFKKSVSSDFYNSLDKLTFLTNSSLGLSETGSIVDDSRVFGEAICNLSNIVIWGILLIYGFLLLFQYFLSKKIEIPWKMFIRAIIFLVFANAAFFICYSLVFFAENITEYIREFTGGGIDFSVLNNDTIKIKESMEEMNVFNMEDLMKITSYFLIFILSITLGMRFILIKAMIIFSPVIFCLGCFDLTEKIFFKIGALFIKLIFYQVFIVVILGVFSKVNFAGDSILSILSISTIFLGIKLAKKIY